MSSAWVWWFWEWKREEEVQRECKARMDDFDALPPAQRAKHREWGNRGLRRHPRYEVTGKGRNAR
jgi:hypothetical protein